MNKLSLSFLVVLIGAIQFSYGQRLKLNVNEFNLGELVESDSLYSTEFSLYNNSNDTVSDVKITSDCKCTSSIISNNKIAPKDTVLFSIAFDSRNQTGKFERKISITSGKDSLQLKLSGSVIPLSYYSKEQFSYSIPPFKGKTKSVQLGQIIEQTSINKKVVLFNPDTVEHSIQLIDTNRFSVNGIQKLLPNSASSFSIGFDAQPEIGIGYHLDTIQFILDSVNQFKLPVAYTMIPNRSIGTNGKLHADTLNYKFARSKNGTVIKKTFILKNTGSETLTLKEVKSECKCVTYDLKNKKIKAGNQTEIRVSFDSKDRLGTQRKKIHLYTDSKHTPVLTLHFKGVIYK